MTGYFLFEFSQLGIESDLVQLEIEFDMWQQLELASEFESDLRDTVDWVRSGLLISVQGKLSWFHLTGLITMALLM